MVVGPGRGAPMTVTDAGPTLRARWLAYVDALPDVRTRIENPVRDAHGRLTGGHRIVTNDGFALRPTERRIAAALADLLGCDGHGRPGVTRIAVAADCGTERVAQALRRFVEAGLLHRVGQFGHFHNDTFTLTIPGDA